MNEKKQNAPKRNHHLKVLTPPKPSDPVKELSQVYAQGFKEGFTSGLKSNFDLATAQRIGFEDGVRHIVTLAEDFLVKERGLPSLQPLAKSNKLPIWWIATLVTNFCEPQPESKPSIIQEPKIKGGRR